MVVGDEPERIRYPPTPPVPVEGLQANVMVVVVALTTCRFAGTEGGVVSVVSTTSGADSPDTFPEASKASTV
jgi:hypothetical protein